MKIKPFAVSLVALLLLFSVCGRCHAQTGDLKITFKFKGEIPAAKMINAAMLDNVQVPDERLIVNKANRGIKNVVVYVYNHRRGTNLDPQPVPKRKLTLTTKQFRFEPHIVVTQVGDTLKIENAGLHSPNFQFFNNQQGLQVPGQANLIKLRETEPAVVLISCNIHPWMKSHILVVDHAFYGKSNEDGVLEINDIPAGKKVVFRAWHETGTFKENIIVDGKEEKWNKNIVEFDIKAGMNDIGVVEVPIDNFKL